MRACLPPGCRRIKSASLWRICPKRDRESNFEDRRELVLFVELAGLQRNEVGGLGVDETLASSLLLLSSRIPLEFERCRRSTPLGQLGGQKGLGRLAFS